MYIYMYVCMYVCMHAGMHACMYVCMHICTWFFAAQGSNCKFGMPVLSYRVRETESASTWCLVTNQGLDL